MAARQLISGLLDKLKTNVFASLVDSPNILAIHENSLFIWNGKEQHVLTITLDTTESNDKREYYDKSQTLLLTNQPSYDVELIQLNNCGHFLALNGKHGVSVMELPRRWGGEGKYEGGKEIIMCRSWNIADRFFSCNKKLQVSQVSWHPGSESHVHLVVLSNDNYLRMYKVTDPTIPTLSIALGRESQMYYLTSESKMSFSNCLGEVAVSFDFAPPIYPKNVKDVAGLEKLVWPVYILNGNGDVYMANTYFSNTLRNLPKVVGPLSMHPPADDNYGVDACSIVCLETNPPILVLTTCSGIIYHCIALHTNDFDSNSKQIMENDDPIDGTQLDIALYVFERVELSLSLQANETKDLSTCPIRLHRDHTISSRYHCTHSSGLHSVVLPLVQYLEKFTSAKEPMDSNLLTEWDAQPSLVEHLICTRPFGSSPNAPVIGIAVSSTTLGATLICILSTWEAIFLPLGAICQGNPVELLSFNPESDDSTFSNANEDGFVDKLIAWLRSSNKTPLLKTPFSSQGVEPTAKQSFELLSNVTQNLREEFLQRLLIASTQLDKRIHILNNQKLQILSDLRSFSHEREAIRNKAENQAERYESLNMIQNSLALRVEKVTEHLQRRIPVLSEEEENMQKELRTCQERLKHLINLMEQMKSMLDFQKRQIEKDQNDQKLQSFKMEISSNQQKQVKELLSKEGEAIADVVKKVTMLKKDLGI